MTIRLFLFFLLINSIGGRLSAQQVALYKQYNGQYDFNFIGNTLNTMENGFNTPCVITTQSSATLNLSPDDEVENAFLYWAGSGTGDFEVKLNGQDITVERTFSLIQTSSGLPFFSAFADVTDVIQATGNGIYTLSELDLTSVISPTVYCNNATNFGGWAIVIIYKNESLQQNQLNVYDGLQHVPTQLNFTIDNLNVVNNVGAEIGFVAWEGDSAYAVNETLRINGIPIGNPPLNPENNAFNGTNSFLGTQTNYNMDLDVYNIENYVQVGNTTADIQLTSGQDFVMINVVVTKLNSQLPDATIVIDNVAFECGFLDIMVDYTVNNLESTADLPALTPISVYVGGVLITTIVTPSVIPGGGSLSGQISITLPVGTPLTFPLLFVVDDIGNGTGIVAEISEINNSFTTEAILNIEPEFNVPPELFTCSRGLENPIFDFSGYSELIITNPDQTVTFYTSQGDAITGTNQITDIAAFAAPFVPMTIFVRIDDDGCYGLTSFELKTRNCPLIIYNYISPNNDGVNDTFYIEGLRDIFVNFELSIYNRWGVLIWMGNNNVPDWNGHATKGYIVSGDTVPDGTYYYVLQLNDPQYPSAFTGFLYFAKG